jgi:tetratricopeptide (TPR) repeat protein
MLNEIARAANPTNPFNHQVHASILNDARDFEGALAAYARVEELDAGRAAHALVTRARLLAKLERFDEAEALLRSAGPDHPRAADVPNELGFLLYRARAFDKVLAHAKELPDDGAMAPALVGAARIATGDVDGGLAELEVALTRFPAFAWAHDKIGSARLEQGKLVDAIRALSAAVTIVPGGAEYQLHLGDALAKSGSGDLAAPHLRKAAESGDLDEEQLVRVGAALLDVEGPRSVHAFFESLEDGDLPTDLAIFRAHARTIFEPVWMPNAGASVLRAIAGVDENDPFGRLQRGLDAFDASIEGEAEGEAIARAAIDDVAKKVDVAFPRRLLASKMADVGRYEDAVQLLAPLGDDFFDARLRVNAFAALERPADAERAIEAFEKRFAEGDVPAPMGVPLRFQLARARGDHEEALALARRAGAQEGESHDDGRLDEWELEEFDCLLALGRVDEAIAFGLGQAGDGLSLGKLAHHALLAGRLRVAASLADKALTLDSKEAYSLHALGRAAEVDGRIDEARALYARAGEADPAWHAWLEELSRLAMADGDDALALAHAERAIQQAGHTCFFAVGVRAQVDLLAGDIERAKLLARRARGLGLSDRHHAAGKDIWGLEALLRGETGEARALFDSFLEKSELASAADRARIERVWGARGRLG